MDIPYAKLNSLAPIAEALAKAKYVFFNCCGNIFANVTAFKQNMFNSVKLFSCYLHNTIINHSI